MLTATNVTQYAYCASVVHRFLFGELLHSPLYRVGVDSGIHGPLFVRLGHLI